MLILSDFYQEHYDKSMSVADTGKKYSRVLDKNGDPYELSEKRQFGFYQMDKGSNPS